MASEQQLDGNLPLRIPVKLSELSLAARQRFGQREVVATIQVDMVVQER